MLKIWGRNNSINVQKVMWTVAELELPHQRIDAGGAFGQLDSPAYGAKNPNRLVPVLEDGELILWESNAIVRYLAARYGAGSLWPEDPAKRALSDRWMDWTFTTIMPDLGVVFWGLIRTAPEKRSMAAIESSAEKLAQIFGLLDAHLSRQPFIAGDRLTIGDIPTGAACYRYHNLPIHRPRLPHLEAWYDRLTKRPPFHDHVMIPLT